MPLNTSSPRIASPESRLERFMTRPQRHRLLHGFPLAAAMPHADLAVRQCAKDGSHGFDLSPDPDKKLLVGVLPHPFCNPQISGCGFCTFPHENHNRQKSQTVVEAVIEEIDERLAAQRGLRGRRISGLYFGGGTANLTPAQPFQQLARKLATSFDLSQAEISLEGVPSYFVRRKPLLIDIMRKELPARHFRISMGIQTFSETWLKRMGRLAFGTADTFAEAVDASHQRGMSASGDLLFNLPGQTLADMKEDVRRAVDIGLDQICLYHLVLFRGLGTAWSRDENLLAAAPGNELACENWLALREYLIGFGFRQTTLTNFERRELQHDERRYQYEPMSFESDRTQVLGFGPSGISFASTPNGEQALKTMNPESAPEFLRAIHSDGPVWNRYYQFDRQDLKVMHVTRRLAVLGVENTRYRDSFGCDLRDDFAKELAMLRQYRLIDDSESGLTLTPRGMFFADSVAALMADDHFRARRKTLTASNDNSTGYM